MNILIRLSSDLIYGTKVELIELLGHRVGLTISEIHDIFIAYVEYSLFNGESTIDDDDFVQQYFMGDTMGYAVFYIVKARLSEITAYLPTELKSVRYNRTHNDGLYILCETNEHINGFRF